MGTTKEEIRGWLERGKEQGATHVLVVCDTFDHSDSPVFMTLSADATENVKQVYARVAETGMQKLMEVYALHLPWEAQLAEYRAFHYEAEAPSKLHPLVLAPAVAEAITAAPKAVQIYSWEADGKIYPLPCVHTWVPSPESLRVCSRCDAPDDLPQAVLDAEMKWRAEHASRNGRGILPASRPPHPKLAMYLALRDEVTTLRRELDLYARAEAGLSTVIAGLVDERASLQKRLADFMVPYRPDLEVLRTRAIASYRKEEELYGSARGMGRTEGDASACEAEGAGVAAGVSGPGAAPRAESAPARHDVAASTPTTKRRRKQ